MSNWGYVQIGMLDSQIADPHDYWRRCYFTAERRVATMRIVAEECVVPAVVYTGQPFQLKYVYQFGQELNQSHGRHFGPWPNECKSIGGPPMENWLPDYHGGYRYVWDGLYPASTSHDFWIWRLLNMRFFHRGHVVQHGRAELSPNQKFTYTWEGTIEELTGLEFTGPATVEDSIYLGGMVYGWHGREAWPWSWPLGLNWLGEYPVHSVTFPIEVRIYEEPPPPPPTWPVFNALRTWVSKEQVSPNEEFTVQVGIDNASETAGGYTLGVYCEGKYQQWATGTIAGKGERNHTIKTTAVKLAQRQFTAPQFLSFTMVLRNAEEQTDQVTKSIYVSLDGNGNGDLSTLSGRVTDKNTGLGINGAAVSLAGQTSYTNTTGHYTIADLDPGYYEISFTKYGYHGALRSKLLVAGPNTLNVTMTPDTEPPPGDGVPWGMVAAGGAVVLGVILIARGLKEDKGK